MSPKKDPQHSTPRIDSMVRIVTAGSVDDGKSTLLGRLLYETGNVYDDQVNAVVAANGGEIDYSLFTDGLAAEREQKITIDVAYRYATFGDKKCILADVPGHEQYTRNMVTGASTADIALLLIDARSGMTQQTKRHLFIASMLRIPQICIIVNKMDTVGYEQDRFEAIKKECSDFVAKLSISSLEFIPASAVAGDMIVSRGEHMLWYEGPTVLQYITNTYVAGASNLVECRFPVQYVIRPHQDFRGVAGFIESGIFRKGTDVVVYPSGIRTTVKNIYIGDAPQQHTFANQSVVMTFEDDIDVSRGDIVVRPGNIPEHASRLDVLLCWFDEKACDPSRRYLFKHGTQTIPVRIDTVMYAINMDDLHREKNVTLQKNDVGRVHMALSQKIFFDPYTKVKGTGSGILIDELTHRTVGAITIRGSYGAKDISTDQPSSDSPILWLSGLSGAGKTTIADALAKRLRDMGERVEVLDGDRMREIFNDDLGFSQEDRARNLQRAVSLAQVLQSHGIIVIASFITPLEEHRSMISEELSQVMHIFVEASLDVCEARDVKGLYKKARAGEIKEFTGISSTFERPAHADIILDTHAQSVDESVSILMRTLFA